MGMCGTLVMGMCGTGNDDEFSGNTGSSIGDGGSWLL